DPERKSAAANAPPRSDYSRESPPWNGASWQAFEPKCRRRTDGTRIDFENPHTRRPVAFRPLGGLPILPRGMASGLRAARARQIADEASALRYFDVPCGLPY